MAEQQRYGTIARFRGSLATDELGDRIHLEGEPASIEAGLVYLAPYEDPFSGFAEHARRSARALSDAGVPICLRSLDPRIQVSRRIKEAGEERWRAYEIVKDLLDHSVHRVLLEIYQLVPHDEMLYNIMLRGQSFMTANELAAVNRSRIIYTVWERDRCSEAAARYLSMVGQCWVANNQDRAMLVRCGVPEDLVKVAPIPYMSNDPHIAFDGRKRKPGPIRFYHIGKWEPRKEQHRIIGAFMMAFEPGEARLVIKTSKGSADMGDYPRSSSQSIDIWLNGSSLIRGNGWTLEQVNRNIKMITQRVSERQLLDLHRMGDVYVTLSHGEGFDMPAFDAKLSGNLMVYTPSGGPQDFAGENDLLVEPTGDMPCHPFYRWGDARYLEYDVETAARAMRRAWRRIRQGGRLRGVDLAAFSSEAVGLQMRKHIEEIVGVIRA